MPPSIRTLLICLVGVALLCAGIGAAAVQGEPPAPPVGTTAPPDPEPPSDPVVTVEDPPAAETITIEVPPLPEPAAAAPKPKVTRPRAAGRRVQPRRVERAVEPETQSRPTQAPDAETKPAVKPKAKPRKKPKQRGRTVTAQASPVQRPIRDRMPAHGVLAAQFSISETGVSAVAQDAVLYLAVALAAVLGMLLAVVGAAPHLASRWPHVFVPVIDASERIVLAGVCLAGVALTLAITWALTGPGAWQ